MQRRKFLATVGSLTAGSAAAMSTGAFTSVTAERSVEVNVVGDRDAFLGIQQTGSANSQDYVNIDSGGEIQLILDESDNGGSGFNPGAETEIDNLLKIVNQGTQTIYFWVNFEDPDGDDEDGTPQFDDENIWFYPNGDTTDKLNDNDGEVLGLTPGESATLGLKADTTGLTKDAGSEDPVAVFHAESEKPGDSSSVDDSGGDFAVVANDGSGDYRDLQTALDNVEGSTILLKDTGKGYSPSPLDLDHDNLTIKGVEGTPTIKTDSQELGGGESFIKTTGNNINLQNLRITDNLDVRGNPGGGNLSINGDDNVVDNVTIEITNGPTGNPVLSGGGNNITVKDSEVRGGPIAGWGNGSMTVVNNTVDGAVDEGIWFSTDEASFEIRNNTIENHDTNYTGKAEIKLVNPGQVNAQTNKEDKLHSILNENNVKTTQVEDDIDAIGGDGITANFLGADYSQGGGFSPISINKAISTAINSGVSSAPDSDAELEIHGATPGTQQPADVVGSEETFTATLDSKNNEVSLEVGGKKIADSDITDGETPGGTDLSEPEFPDGVPEVVDIAVSLSSTENTVAVKDLSVSGSGASVSDYHMAASSGDRKVFEFVNVPADGTVTVEGTVYISEESGRTDFGIDFADPDGINNRESLLSKEDPR